MKNILLPAIFILWIQVLFAQDAVPIPAYAKQQMPMGWYQEQSRVWKKKLDKNPGDADAWFNYFKAQRILIFHDGADKMEREQKQQQLENIVEEMGKEIPNSYEYNYCRWQLGGNDMKYYPWLEKAIAIEPTRTEHIDYMINIGEMERDLAQRNEFSIKKQKAGLMSSGMLYYNFNTLTGLQPNAILLTAGDNDTYPAWALQAQGIRTDVKVLNLYLLRMKDYREKIFRELGIQNIELENKMEEDSFFAKRMVQHISSNSFNYPVYLALTAAGCSNKDEIESDLYLTGLTYIYSTTSFDNMAVLKRNFEKQYALDYIDKSFYDEISPELVKRINTNYLVPMLKLYQHYKVSGDLQKQNWIKEKLICIATGSDEEDSVKKYLD